MKRVYFALGILILLTAYFAAQGILIGSALRDMRRMLAREDTDADALGRSWKKIGFVLELTAARADLDDVEEDLARLSRTGADKEEIKAIKERLDRSLSRIHDGFVPSFAGVF